MPFSPNDSVDILLKIKAEGQAELKAIDAAVRGVSGSMKDGEASSKALEAAIKALTGSTNTLNKSVIDVNTSLTDNNKKLKDVSDGMTTSILKATLLSSAFLKIGEAVKAITIDSAQYAARTEQLAAVMDQLARTNGLSIGSVRLLSKDIQGLGITTQESYLAINRMIVAQLDLSKATDLARVAQDSAKGAGISSSDALQKITSAIIQHRSQQLKSLNLQTDFNLALRQGAAALDQSVTSLTTSQRANILLNAVLETGKQQFGSYEQSLATTAGQMQSLSRYADEAKLALGEQFEAPLSRVIRLLTTTSKLVKDNSEEFAGLATHITAVSIAAAAFKLTPGPLPVKIGAAAIGGLLTEYLGDTDKAEEAIARAQDAIQRLEDRKVTLQREANNGLITDRKHYVDELDRLGKTETIVQQTLADKVAAIYKQRQDKLAKTPDLSTGKLLVKGLLGDFGSGIGSGREELIRSSKVPSSIDLGNGRSISGAEIQNLIANPRRLDVDPNGLKGNTTDYDGPTKTESDAAKRAAQFRKAAQTALQGYEDQSNVKEADGVQKLIVKYENFINKYGAYLTQQEKGRAVLAESKEINAEYTKEIEKQTKLFEKAGGELYKKIVEDNNKAITDGIKSSEDFIKKTVANLKAVKDLELNSSIRGVEGRNSFSNRLLGLSARPGDELAVGRQQDANSIATAERIYALKLSAANQELDFGKRAGLIRDLTLQKEDQIIKIREDGELRIAELRRKELDDYRNAAGSIFDALTSKGGGGLKDFATGQLKTVERQLFVNMAGETFNGAKNLGVGNLIGNQKDAQGNSTFLGRLLAGTPFGAQDKAVDYARRTANATERIAAGAGIGAGLSGGIPSGVLGLPGIPGLSKSDIVKYGSDVKGLTGSGSFGGFLKNYGGPALGLGAGAYSLASGIGQGGVLGGVASAGGAIGLVGSGIQLASKAGMLSGQLASGLGSFLPGLGIGISLLAPLLGGLLGDPKVKRQNSINDYTNNNKSALPASISRDIDISGADVDYGSNGSVRTITIIKQTNNVNAIDTKSISDHWEPIADAMKMALDLNHPVTDTIRQGLPG
jgi:hypothetical protein